MLFTYPLHIQILATIQGNPYIPVTDRTLPQLHNKQLLLECYLPVSNAISSGMFHTFLRGHCFALCVVLPKVEATLLTVMNGQWYSTPKHLYLFLTYLPPGKSTITYPNTTYKSYLRLQGLNGVFFSMAYHHLFTQHCPL